MITVTVAGLLGKDAEWRQAVNSQVCSFIVAGNTGIGDRKQTHWFNCSLWGRQGEALAQYLTKGSPVTVIGEYSEREYEGKQYKELRVNQIELHGGIQSTNNQQSQQNNPQQRQQQPSQSADNMSGQNVNAGGVVDESIPF